MDFTTMGTVAAYIKQKNLRFAANYKINTGQKLADSEGNLEIVKSTEQDQFVESREKSNEEIGIAKLASIRQRLASGHKLSNEDMSYLQQKDPGTYKKAKRADEAREELKGELKKAKTKQEARQAVTKALIKASAEASADIAACKSDSNADSTDISGRANNFVSVDKNAVNDTADRSLNESDFQNLAMSSDYYSRKNTVEYANDLFAEPEHVSNKSITEKATDNSDTPQNVMQRFIMTIRALEAEWANFTKSKEYEEMPNNEHEKYLLDSTNQDNYAPNRKMWGAVNAYRNSMTYKDAKILAESK